MNDRLPPIPEAKLTPEQRAAAAELSATARGSVFGPFVPLIRSPEMLNRLQRLGQYLRYDSALAPRLSEMAILVVARHWSQQYEWHVHHPIALKSGLQPAKAAAIAAGRRPDAMDAEEAALHDLLVEILRTQSVSDPTWARAIATFEERGVIDLLGLAGYYSTLGMVMNAARTPLPPGVPAPLQPL
jgi:4-carboxymuconolactone decarboxylase